MEALPPVATDDSGQTYIVKPLENGLLLAPLALLYLVSYAMGMLVRYHPAQWFAFFAFGSVAATCSTDLGSDFFTSVSSLCTPNGDASSFLSVTT